MNKIVLPTILILILTSVICVFIASEYSNTVREKNAAYNKLNGQTTEEQAETEETTEELTGGKKRLMSDDTVILTGKNLSENELIFKNIRGGSAKPLSFDGRTTFLSKHGSPLTASEIEVGDIVDISFSTNNALLSEVKQSEKIWENKGISKFEIDEKKKTIKVGDDLFKLNNNLYVASNGLRAELMDVTGLDVITIKGIDKDIYSIKIDKGHGYIRVLNDSYFVGGWIEIGQDIIKILTEDMLIPVPEGDYDIKVTNKGYVGRESITVERDKETKLDLSKVDIEEVAIGHVQFDITPDYAQLYVDGIMTDFEERVPLEYGIHSVRAELAGYETVNVNIRVGSEFANIDIELDEELEKDKDSSSSSSSSNSLSSTDNSSSSTDTSGVINSSTSVASVISDNKKLYVEGPEGVEVYFDGTYIGIAPCSTNKVTGNHTVTLSKSGYNTKSYTINIENDGNDLTMSFSELTQSE